MQECGRNENFLVATYILSCTHTHIHTIHTRTYICMPTICRAHSFKVQSCNGFRNKETQTFFFSKISILFANICMYVCVCICLCVLVFALLNCHIIFNCQCHNIKIYLLLVHVRMYLAPKAN